MEEKKKSSKINLIFANDIMTAEVVVVNETMFIGQVAHLMLRERVSGYPVVDDEGKTVGIVTLTDLFKLISKMADDGNCEIGEQIGEVKNKPVSEIMSSNVKTIARDTPLTEIIDAVVNRDIHTFPVVEEEKLVGIIGRHDVLNAIFVHG